MAEAAGATAVVEEPAAAAPAPAAPAPAPADAGMTAAEKAEKEMAQLVASPLNKRKAIDLQNTIALLNTCTGLPDSVRTRMVEAAQLLVQFKDREALLASAGADGKVYTEAQMNQLRAQIEAYRMIVKNEPLTPDMQQRIAPVTLSRRAPEQPTLPAIEAPAIIIPSGLDGSGLSKTDIVVEREYRVASRMAYRANELQNLPNKLPPALASKAKIELLALRLVDLQRRVRAEIVAEKPGTESFTGTALARKALRARKRQLQRDAKTTERQEQKQREDMERRKKQKHVDYLQSILAHGRKFRDFHRDRRAAFNNVARAVLQMQNSAEREAQREADRQEKERMRKLMEEDEAGYRALIDKRKHSRLAYLLEKTDE